MVEQLKISRKTRRKTSRNSRKNKRRLIFAVVLIILIAILAAAGIFFANNFAKKEKAQNLQKASFSSDGVSTKPLAKTETDDYSVAANYPRMLEIPAINVSSRMTPLGLLAPNQDGSQQLDVPKNISDTGWYDCSINPVSANICARKKLPNDGNFAMANLVDGHSCEGYEMKCVFDDLAKLKNGDEITIELGDHSKIIYVVKKVQTLSLAEVDMGEMMKSIEAGKDGLNLITCAGDWSAEDSRGQTTPDQRVEVYAIKK